MTWFERLLVALAILGHFWAMPRINRLVDDRWWEARVAL